MDAIKVLKRFPYGGRYREIGEVLELPPKVAYVLTILRKAEYWYGEPAKVNASAAAVEQAEKSGIDISSVAGTGKDGKILKRDMDEYLTRMMKSD